MGDHRIVQCFGIERRPHKAPKYCRRRYMWTAAAAARNFGGRGVHACPYCGTIPDFRHPFNRFLNGELTEEDAQAAMPAYLEKLEKENNT